MEDNTEKNRMRKLTQSFAQKGEIFKEEREETNAEKLQEEFKRLSSLASGEKTSKKIQESEQSGFLGGAGQSGGHGINQMKGVNSIVDNLYNNPVKHQSFGNSVALREGEALELSIKRTLSSGAPVNDIAFYDEINWNLANLGFPSKLPQDIKSAILKLIQ
jgi:hypothetical protein